MEKFEDIFQALAKMGGKTFRRAYFDIDHLLSIMVDEENLSKSQYREIIIKKPSSFYYDFNKSVFSYKGKEPFTFYKMKSFLRNCLKKEGGWEAMQGPPLERIGGRLWKGTFFDARRLFLELLQEEVFDEEQIKLLKKDEITKIFYNIREDEFKITGGNKFSSKIMKEFLEEKLAKHLPDYTNYNNLPCRSDQYAPSYIPFASSENHN